MSDQKKTIALVESDRLEAVSVSISIVKFIMLGKDSADTFGHYLDEIGRYPVLTRTQEIDLGRSVQRWVKIRDAKGFDAAEELCPDGFRSRQKMINCNLRLVVAVARKYTYGTMLDRVQEGNDGLILAVEKFDPGRGYKFSTMAYWWIRQAINRHLASHDRVIRLPIHMLERVAKIRTASRDLWIKTGRFPHLEEIAVACELSVDQVLKAKKVSTPIGSLDFVPKSKSGNGNADPIGYFVPSNDPLPDEFAIGEEQYPSQLIDILFDQTTLNQSEIEILRLRHMSELSLTQIGDRYGISRERVRQVLAKGLRQLRTAKEKVGVDSSVLF